MTDSEYVKNALEAYQESMRGLTEVAKAHTLAWATERSAVRNAIEKFAAAQKEATDFMRTQPERNAALIRAIDKFAAAGWWIPPSLPVTFFFELAGDSAQDEKALTNRIVAFANENDAGHLAELILTWTVRPLQKRSEIFEDALWAHRQKRYSLSVAVLLPQVEGAIREVIREVDGFAVKDFVQVRSRFEKKFESKAKDAKVPSGDVVEMSANYVNLEYIRGLFNNFDPDSDEPPIPLSRHASAHGRATYGTLENSTRLLLLFDMLNGALASIYSQRDTVVAQGD